MGRDALVFLVRDTNIQIDLLKRSRQRLERQRYIKGTHTSRSKTQGNIRPFCTRGTKAVSNVFLGTWYYSCMRNLSTKRAVQPSGTRIMIRPSNTITRQVEMARFIWVSTRGSKLAQYTLRFICLLPKYQTREKGTFSNIAQLIFPHLLLSLHILKTQLIGLTKKNRISGFLIRKVTVVIWFIRNNHHRFARI